MRRLLVFVFIVVGLILGGVGSFAAMTSHQTKQMAAAPTEMKGAVTKITAKTLWIKDEAGKSHRVIVSDPKMMQGIKVGDNVDVKKEKGKVVSIQKIEGTMPAGSEILRLHLKLSRLKLRRGR